MRYLTLFIFIFIFIGCTTVGTKTVYKTKVQPRVQKIGYCAPNEIKTLSLIYTETAQVFDSTIYKCANIYSLDTPLNIKLTKNSLITKELLSDICEKNNLDALLITRLRFIHVTYTALFIPVASNYDTDVEMQLYSKDGELLYATKHNTFKGNSYMKKPTVEQTIHDGITGAFARIAKEIGWKVSN